MTFEDKILHILKTHKIRHNDKREKLIKIFRDNQREMDLREIVTEMRKQFPNITQSTINSNLQAFEIAGLLVKSVNFGDPRYTIAESRIKGIERKGMNAKSYAG